MTQTMLPPSQTATGQPVYVITDADKKRQQAIADAWKAYDGDFAPQLQKTPEGIDPNVVINQCAPIVDTGVDFLFGQEVEISVEEAAPKEAQELIDKAWGRKEMRVPLLQDLAYNGAMGRNAFLRIVPSEDDEDMPDKAKTYRLVTVDPAIVSVQTAPQDVETVLCYCLQYSVTQKIDGKDQLVYYREEIMRIDPDGNAKEGKPDDDDTWQIQHWTQIGYANMQPRNDHWTPAGPPILWNYPFPPLFHNKNLPRPNEFWGRADIRPDIIGMNKSLNLTLSCIISDEIIYGLPILYANGIGDTVVERKAGRIASLPTPESKITAVAIPSDIPNMLSVANDLRSSIDETSHVPGVATGRMSTVPHGNLPGVTIELLFMSLLKQTDKKRCLYGALIIDVSKALLVLAGLANTVDDIDIELSWQSPLPHDDLPAVQAAIAKKEVSISDTTLQRELGYDPIEEQKLRTEEMKNKLQLAQMAQDALPPGLPGTPLLPNQPPPPPPVAAGAQPAQQPAQAGGLQK